MHPEDKGLIAQQILDWVREHAVVSDPRFGRCGKLVLRHMSLEGKPQADVKAFPLSPGETLVGEIEMLVNNIVDAAQRNADDHASGLQKYAICAYYPQEPQYKPQKVFRVAAEDLVDSGSVEPSEPPTEPAHAS